MMFAMMFLLCREPQGFSFLWTGFEQIDTANGPRAVVQEWRCEMVVRWIRGNAQIGIVIAQPSAID
ncbi:MAG: hypothetical protein ABWY12_07600 [Burkholderiales bacterium]